MVVSGRVDMAPDNPDGAAAQLLARYEASVAVAQVYLKYGFEVVIEDVILGEMLLRFLELLPWPRVHFIMLNPALDIVAGREERRLKTAYGKNWSISGLAGVLQRETPAFGYWLDSSDLGPEETADQILAESQSSLIDVSQVLARYRCGTNADLRP
jgi:hypothetical protein